MCNDMKQGDIIIVKTPGGFLMKPPKGKVPQRFVVVSVGPTVKLELFNNDSKLYEPRVVQVADWSA
jgi:hypothetical protein